MAFLFSAGCWFNLQKGQKKGKKVGETQISKNLYIILINPLYQQGSRNSTAGCRLGIIMTFNFDFHI